MYSCSYTAVHTAIDSLVKEKGFVDFWTADIVLTGGGNFVTIYIFF